MKKNKKQKYLVATLESETYNPRRRAVLPESLFNKLFVAAKKAGVPRGFFAGELIAIGLKNYKTKAAKKTK